MDDECYRSIGRELRPSSRPDSLCSLLSRNANHVKRNVTLSFATQQVTLLDHMDWLTDEQIKMEWMVLQKKCAPGAKLMFRSASEGMPFDALKFSDYKLSTPILPKNGALLLLSLLLL